jgi:acyl-CoA thioesterase-2
MSNGIADLLDHLDLEPIEENIFRGHHYEGSRQRVFGGQVAAQAVVAASRTVDLGRIHSLHSYFLRLGDPTIPILYTVDRIRDGRTFATRRVVAIQHGQAIFNLACSFHVDEEGLDHSDAMPDVPGPHELPELGQLSAELSPGSPLKFLEDSGLDVRFVGGPPWTRKEVPQAREAVWMRTRERLGDDPVVHLAIVTFSSDLILLPTILQRHGISAWRSGHFAASIDHCMWFHHPIRADEWLLYDAESPAAHGARGLSLGSIYDERGLLVASIAQEGLVRKRWEK